MYQRIEICGAIASGKTTLARILQEEGYDVVYEHFEDNPFLKDFYLENNQDVSMETELVFLLLHYRLLCRKHQNDDILVSDFSLYQDYCYSILNLSDEARQVFQTVYQYCISKLSERVLVIYLKCDTKILLDRIRERGRAFEGSIDETYLQRLINIMEQELLSNPHIHIIDSGKYDFLGKNRKCIIDGIKKVLFDT